MAADLWVRTGIDEEHLEEQKISQRTVYPENPPKVGYALTELGKSIYPVLKSLCDQGTNYQDPISQISGVWLEAGKQGGGCGSIGFCFPLSLLSLDPDHE